jgi:hypothetical protein
MVGAGDRRGVGQPGQGLVAVARQQQALQVVAQITTRARLDSSASKGWA